MVVCKMRLRVKSALLHKLGFVQPPYFYTPCRRLTSRKSYYYYYYYYYYHYYYCYYYCYYYYCCYCCYCCYYCYYCYYYYIYVFEASKAQKTPKILPFGTSVKYVYNVRHTGAVKFTVSTVGLRLFAMLQNNHTCT